MQLAYASHETVKVFLRGADPPRPTRAETSDLPHDSTGRAASVLGGGGLGVVSLQTPQA